ncbi:uncharacterized protein M6B38_147350 [Iris pallida]|uniref:Spc7 kinetochore protein domain-containing protein n=1 Tax=Iris pallida TaxID=29817 RepID=A0AAX6FAU9_IRIPA|nr:uncharacterized protein M6B38_147350 [Iris pallida]
MDHRSCGDLDEETVAWKRSRRVSFAETTAVHVFDRDEDFDTPPTDSKPSPDSLGFRGDHSDTDDSKGSREDGDEAVDEEEDEEEEEEERFVRDMDSSPGSAVGSVTSNDDDNFFGPVSTSFIKSGRLSDSGMSDDNNHDITLDSTAFSLHFQNIARPEDCSANSSRSLRSPTEYLVPTDSPGFVVPKGFIQQVPLSRLSDGKMSDTAGNSTNMSIIVENPDRYDDYGKMSPTLEALLTEANKRTHHDSPSNAVGSLTSKVCDDEVAVAKESGKDDTTTSSRRATGNAADDTSATTSTIHTPVSGRCSTGIEGKLICDGIPSPSKAETPPIDASSNKKTLGTLSSKVSDSFRDVCEAIQSNQVAVDAQNTDLFTSLDRNIHNELTLQSGLVNVELSPGKVRRGKHDSNSSPELRPTLVPMNGQEQSLPSELGMHTPKDAVQPLPTPLHGSISSLRAKRQQLFYDPSVLSQTRLIYTPDNEQPPSSLKIELTRFGERISAIKSRISKSKLLTSPNSIDSRQALHDKDRLPTELNVRFTMGKTNNDLNRKHIVASDTNTEDALNDDQEASLHNTSLQGNHLEFQIAQTVSATSLKKKEVIGDTVEMTTGESPILVTQSDINRQSQLTPYGPIKQVSTLDVHDLNLVGALQHKEPSQVSNNLRNAISSPVDMPRFELSKSQEVFLSPKANGTTISTAFFEENDIPVNNCTYISSNNSQEQKDNSRNCNSRSQVELTSSVSLKERMSVRNSCSPNKSAVDVAYKETSAINKSMKLCSVDSLQSPNNNTNSNISMVQSSDLVEMVQTELSKDPMLYGHDFSYHGQQYVSELHSVEDEIPGKKRSIEQIFLTDKDDISEKSRSQKNPKVSSNVMGGNSGIFVVGHFHSSNESESIGGEEPRRHWRDMISRVSNNMRRLFSPAIFKLSLQELDILEDALSALQNGRKYDRISASLRNHDFSSVQKREAEASALLDKLAYEKAMVQLKRIRLDHLSSKMHLRKSRIQECDELKAICSRLCFLGARTVQESQIHSLTSNHSRINQEEDVRVTSMRQELEVIGQKVKLLVKSFESYCKIKGNMNCDGIINAVNVHLETTNCCRVIQQDLQLWKISDVVKKKDCCSIILNYRDLLTKRYTINNSVSNMVANNLLIDASIEKNFPNMNACTPFQFVLNDKDVGIVGKVASLKHLQHDTMETNLLLGVLLDVLEEILVSRMELWNLISSAFHLCCSGQLELRLCFLSFKSGRKVSLSLDLSSLNCGVYPSEPSDLRFQISNELPSSISDEIQRTIRNLPNGRPMIFRLCQSISQVVKVSI